MTEHCHKILFFFIKHYVNVVLKCEHELSCSIITLMIIIVIEYAVFCKHDNIDIKNICFNHELITLFNTVINK